jgi:hypothetical protein
MAMLLYSLTVLWFAQEGHTLYKPPDRAWYRHKLLLPDTLRAVAA